MSKKVALLIGVSEYGEGIPSLSAPLNDVEAMKRVLENPKMGGFDEVTPLTNPDPTAMRLAVQQIFAHLGKDDLVLLFFSGHGITDDNNRLYLATKGTSKDFYKATSVPASFLQDVSLESYAKRQVIVLDCCYSGAFAEGWQAKTVGIDLEKELGAEGRVVLTSSTATQTSFQQEGEELSLYTQYLIEGIETGAADKDGNGKIYARELHDYAKAKVKEVKPKQKPEIIIDKEGFNILLSQAPVDDPELDFRKLVEKYATEGRITVAGHYILRKKRQELGITEEKSEEIVNEVLAPYHKRLENVELYKQAFTEAVEQHYPLTERLLNELQDFQDILGLEDQDIAKDKQQILAEKEAEHQHQQGTQRQEQEEYNNKLQQYKQEFSKAVEREYPLSKHTREQINSWQQSLGLRAEDIKRIEQPILAAKEREIKEEERQRQKEQKAEKQEEKPRQQEASNIPSQPQQRQAGILSSKKARRRVLLGSTALGLVLIFFGRGVVFWVGNIIILVGGMRVFLLSGAQRNGFVGRRWGVKVGVLLWWLSNVIRALHNAFYVGDFWYWAWSGASWSWSSFWGWRIFGLLWGELAGGETVLSVLYMVGFLGFIIYLTSIYYGRW